MKRIKTKPIMLILTSAVLALFLMSVECTVGGCSVTFNDYTARAVNIKAADDTDGFYKVEGTSTTLVGTTVSLYAYDSTTGSYSASAYDTATVQDDGTFTFLSPVSNRYKLTATATDWIFVPQYIEVTNSGAASKDLYAYPKDGAGEYTIIASWEKADIDVDLTLTYGPADSAGALPTNPWETGDTKATTERLRIFYNGRGSTNGTGISLDMDVTDEDAADISRVETISLHDASWFNDADVVKIYLDTALSDQVLTGYEGTPPNLTDAEPSAYAQVDLMYFNESAGTSEHYGTWYVPWNTYENTVQVIQMVYASSTYTISSANNAVTLNGTGTGYSTGIKSIIWE